MPAVEELDDTRLAIWMEDVPHQSGQWSMSDYRRAGRALGRLAGRFPEGALPDDLELARRDLRGYLFGRVTAGVMPGLSADETWTHPLVAGVVDPSLRTDLVALRGFAPAILDRLDACREPSRTATRARRTCCGARTMPGLSSPSTGSSSV